MSTEVTTTQQSDETTELMRKAKLLSTSQFLPKCYQNRPDDCLVALQWAQRSGRDPMELLQNSFVVHGTPGLYSRYMLALANREGIFDKPVRFVTKGSGDSLEVTAVALIDGEEYTASASMAMARAEKWDRNPKYNGPMAEHMLKWRSLAFLIRFTAPEVLLGLYTVEELEDVHYAEHPPRDVTPRTDSAAALVQNMIDGPGEEEPSDEPEEPREVEPEEDDIDTRIMRGEDVPDGELFGGTEAPQEDPA